MIRTSFGMGLWEVWGRLVSIRTDWWSLKLSTIKLIVALTNGLRYFRYRDESKSSIRLSDIQDKYFRILETNFGHIQGSR